MYLTDIQKETISRIKKWHNVSNALDIRYMFGPDMVEYSRAYSLIKKLEKKD
jgi:hypothetical protein